MNKLNEYLNISGRACLLFLTLLTSWQDEAEDLLEGQYIKWRDGQSHRIRFLTGQGVLVPGQAPDGKTLNFLHFDVVLIDGGKELKKVLSTSSKGLIRQFLALDRQKPLGGRTFEIKAVGEGKLRKFEITPID